MLQTKNIIATALIALAALVGRAQERLILLNEGTWQADNGRITYFEDGEIVSNRWFRDVNGSKLGDTPNDIIAVNDNLIAIAINWSNIIQFITPDGKAVAATEDIPNNRNLATDGNYVYVTSFAHECLVNGRYVDFTKGFVAKIDVSTFKVVDAVEVGYEPEGIAYYKGYLFVANSGGYAFEENHDYETTVSIIDAATMKVVRTIDTYQINLCGTMSQSGQYLCVGSSGDYYYNVTAATIILDCDAVLGGAGNDDCFVKLDCAATHSCTAADGSFYVVGSRYSYIDGDYTFDYMTVDPVEVMETLGGSGYESSLPGTVLNDLKKMSSPYGIYVNPYTGYIYATDAGMFASSGKLYQWSPLGKLLGSFGTYINPGHFLALKPDGYIGGVNEIIADATDESDSYYNLQGIRVTNPIPGQLYIQKGKKIIYRQQ